MATSAHRAIRRAMQCYPFLGGHGRIVDSRAVRRLRFSEPVMRLRTAAGFELTVDPNDFIGRHVYFTGRALSHDVAEVMMGLVRPGDRVLDIGANVGYISCALLHHEPSCRVVSVEPQPDVYSMLTANLAPFGGRGVGVQAAISDRPGSGTMVVGNNRGASHLVDGGREGEGGSPAGAITVPLLTAPELLSRAGVDRVDLIKIDVEGHEEAVLRSLGPVLAGCLPRAVVFEHFGDPTARGSMINELFTGLGYALWAVERGWFRWRLRPAEGYLRSGRRARDFVAMIRADAARLRVVESGAPSEVIGVAP